MPAKVTKKVDAEADKALLAAVKGGKRTEVEAALKAGADINGHRTVGEYPGITPLHLAIAKGQTEIARLLLDRGADPNAVDADRTGVLAYACGAMMMGDKVSLETVDLLLHKGAVVDACSNGNITALHHAVESGRRDVIERLLARGADINHTSAFRTVLFEACKADGDAMFHYLLEKGADAEVNGAWDTVKDEPISDAFTLLEQAEMYGNDKVAAWLRSRKGASKKSTKVKAAPTKKKSKK